MELNNETKFLYTEDIAARRARHAEQCKLFETRRPFKSRAEQVQKLMIQMPPWGFYQLHDVLANGLRISLKKSKHLANRERSGNPMALSIFSLQIRKFFVTKIKSFKIES